MRWARWSVRPTSCDAVVVLTALLGLAAPQPTATAETQVAFYLGGAKHHDSDLDLSLGGGGGDGGGAGGDVTFGDVSWEDESFESPLYYGARVTHFFEPGANWGLALDFVHAKMYAEGVDDDDDDGDALDATFDSLDFSHGLNLLTLNALYRWNAEASPRDALLRRLQPYVGVGAGVAIPHVEVDFSDAAGGSRTHEYQLAGPAFQVLAGVQFPLAEHWSLFGEYRFSYADLEADLEDGGTLETEALTHHFVFGVAFRF